MDDDENDLLLNEILLSEAGFEVLKAASGEAGLAMALEQRPGAALVDFEMPGMGGLAVAARLRAELGDALFLVALTGHSHPEAVALAKAGGFDAFQVKGDDPAALVRCLKERRR